MLKKTLTILDVSVKKLALRLYKADQRKTNPSLEGLSAIQQSKVIAKMFKILPTSDKDALYARAEHEKAKMQPDATGVSVEAKDEITPYELFVREQSKNPAILGIPSPRDRELKMLEIYNSLPAKALEMLEERAQAKSLQRAQAKHVERVLAEKAATKEAAKKPPKKKQSASKEKAAEATKAKSEEVAAPNKPAKKSITAYSIFVKEQMPLVQELPPQERIKEVAKRWHAMDDAAKAQYQLTAKMTAELISEFPAPEKTASTAKAKSEESIAPKSKPAKRDTSSVYSFFVKEQMPLVQELPSQERMKEIAKRWHAMDDAAKAQYQLTVKPSAKQISDMVEQVSREMEAEATSAVAAEASAEVGAEATTAAATAVPPTPLTPPTPPVSPVVEAAPSPTEEVKPVEEVRVAAVAPTEKVVAKAEAPSTTSATPEVTPPAPPTAEPETASKNIVF